MDSRGFGSLSVGWTPTNPAYDIRPVAPPSSADVMVGAEPSVRP